MHANFSDILIILYFITLLIFAEVCKFQSFTLS